MAITGSFVQTLRLNESADVNGINYTGSPAVEFEAQAATVGYEVVWRKSATIASPESIDVTALTGAFGQAIDFAEVHAIIIKNNSTTATLTVGGDTNALINQTVLSTSGCMSLATSLTVDGTHKVIKLNPSASLTYEILIAGEE